MQHIYTNCRQQEGACVVVKWKLLPENLIQPLRRYVMRKGNQIDLLWLLHDYNRALCMFGTVITDTSKECPLKESIAMSSHDQGVSL